MKKKRILSLLLSMLLVFSLLPVTGTGAAGAPEPTATRAEAARPGEAAGAEAQPSPAEPEAVGQPKPIQAGWEFTKQPVGGNIAPGGYYKFSWATNFTPLRIELFRCKAGEYYYSSFKSLSGTATAWDIPYDTAAAYGPGTDYQIRAYYGNGSSEYVASPSFKLSLTPRTVIRTSGSVTTDPGSSYHLTWTTNFAPVRIELFKCEANEYYYYSFKSLSGTATAWDIPYDTAAAYGPGTDYQIRAYYGSGSSEYVASPSFKLSLTPRQFTTQPQGGVVKSSQALPISWNTNFTPVKVMLAKCSGYIDMEFSELSHSQNSDVLTYGTMQDKGSGLYCLHAYYGTGNGDYNASQAFRVEVEKTIFTAEPQTAISLNEGGSAATLSWICSAAPSSLKLMAVPAGQANAQELKSLSPTASSCSVSFQELEALGAETGKLYLRAEHSGEIHNSRVVNYTLRYSTSGTAGNLSWSYNEASRLLTITGAGSMSSWSGAASVPWKHWTAQITRVEIDAGVTSIGSSAFLGAGALESISLPASLSSVGGSAFSGCDALRAVSFGGSEKAWSAVSIDSGNAPLTNAALSFAFIDSGSCGTGLSWKLTNDNTLTVTGTGAMADYNNGSSKAPWAEYRSRIGKVVLQSGVSSVGAYAFYGCSALKRFDASAASLTGVGTYAFYNCNQMNAVLGLDKASLTDLGSYVFTNCKSLASISLGSGLTVIPVGAFYNCSRLSTIVIPAGVSAVNSYAFQGCSVLVSVSFAPGSAVTAIGTYAFSGCSALTKISLPDQISTIGGYAFSGCSHLVSVNLPASLTSLGSCAFQNCSNLSGKLVSPAGLTSIPGNAFQNCAKLTDFSFNSGLKTIGASAFSGCTGLNAFNLRIPAGVTSIGAGAFQGVPISNLWLPGSVTTIGANAFQNCAKLNLVYYGGLRPQWDLMSIASGNEALIQASRCYQGCYGTESSYSWSCSGEGVLSVYSDSPSAMANLTLDTQPWKDFRQYIVRVDVRNQLTGVGNNAFRGLSALREAHIDATVTSIGAYAFYGCSSLTDVYYNSLESDWSGVSIGSYNTPLQNAAMHFLTSIEGEFNSGLGWQISTDGTLTFINMNWGSDDDLDIPDFDDPEDAPWYPYRNQITAVVMEEDAVTRIGENAFSCLSNLRSVRFSRVVTELGENAFCGCPDEMEIFFPGLSYDWWQLIYDENDNIIPGNDCLEESYVSYDKLIGDFGSEGTGPWLEWTLDNKGLLYIYSPGGYASPDASRYAIPDYDVSAQEPILPPWADHAHLIRKVVLEEGVTRIGEDAFNGYNVSPRNAYLSEITIPDSVTSIGPGALEFTKLVNVVFPDSVTELGAAVLYDCGSLVSVRFPAGITQIPNSICSGLSSLESVTIPEGVTTIGQYAFSGCGSLKTVRLPASLTTVKTGAFSQCSGLSSGDVYVDDDWFNMQDKISFEASNTTIQNAAWHYREYGGELSTGLRWVLQPNGCLEISGDGPMPDFASNTEQPWFSVRGYVSSLSVGDGVSSVGNNAFRALPRLTAASIGGDVTRLGVQAFISDILLADINLPEGLSSIGNNCFTSCNALSAVTLPQSLSTLEYGAFYNCKGLQSVQLPDGLSSMGTHCFDGCANLRSVSLPAALKTIPSYAFMNCVSLQQVQIEENVTLINTAAFGNCPALTELRYGGVQSWWNSISISDTVYQNYSNSDLTGANLICLGVPLNEKHFPDPGFLACLQAEEIDQDGSGYLSLPEREAVAALYCDGQEIESLEGVQWFPCLEELDCSDNPLTELDLSGLTALRCLSCWGCRLTELDLSGLSALEQLYCDDNWITELDLSPVTQLWYLSCRNNRLTELDISPLDQVLIYLDVGGNRLESLDVAGSEALKTLECAMNGMTELTLNPSLQQLRCDGNALTQLDLENVPGLMKAVKEGQKTEAESFLQYHYSDGVADHARLLCVDRGVKLLGVAQAVEVWFVYKPNDGTDNCPIYVSSLQNGAWSAPILLTGEDCCTDEFDYCAAYHFSADPYRCESIRFSDDAGHQTAALDFTQGTVEAEELLCRVYYADSFDQVGDGPDLWLISSGVSVQPSCTEDGSNTFYGLITLQSITETEPALGHRFQAGTVHAPGCVEEGWTDYVCPVCEALERRDFTAPAGHSWGDWTEAVPASCTAGGSMTRSCGLCGETETAPSEPLGHDWAEPGYSFSEAASPGEPMNCAAATQCARCGETVTETAQGVYAVLSAPTTEQIGFGAWSFAFENAAFSDQLFTLELAPLEAEYLRVCVLDRSDALRLGYSVWGAEGRKDLPPIPPSGVDKDGFYYYEFQMNLTGFGQGLSLNDGDALLCPQPEGAGLDPATDAAGRGWVVYALDQSYAAAQVPDIWPQPGETLTAPSCTEEGLLRYTGLLTGQTLEETAPALGHEYENGQCIRCGRQLKASELYIDVKDGAWYADAVLWATLAGVTSGTGEGRFSPNLNCTRAQVVTFLWRAAGSPDPEELEAGQEIPSFQDVPATAWYAEAVRWAARACITSGTSENQFSPNQPCTRAQTVVFLYRAAMLEPDFQAPAELQLPFTDVAENAWYRDAVAWAVANGVSSGTGAAAFSPNRICTRAQAVTLLWRALAE